MKTELKELYSYGSPFSHDVTSCHNITPTKFKWVYNKPSTNDVEVYLDYALQKGFESKCKNKFLWICESRGIIQPQIQYFLQNIDKFKETYKKIFVHDHELLSLGDNIEYCPPAANCTWIKNRNIHKKTKLVSMISSGKEMCAGHAFRNSKMKQFQSLNLPIDYYGRSFNPFQKKEDVLIDYYFSITIENEKYSNYYTEKLMDCFATGTIPIYHGTPEVGKMFDINGIVLLDDKFSFDMLTPEFYFSKIEYITKNYELCVKHQTSDDYIYERIIESL